jgi:hypothetical protein
MVHQTEFETQSQILGLSLKLNPNFFKIYLKEEKILDRILNSILYLIIFYI